MAYVYCSMLIQVSIFSSLVITAIDAGPLKVGIVCGDDQYRVKYDNGTLGCVDCVSCPAGQEPYPKSIRCGDIFNTGAVSWRIKQRCRDCEEGYHKDEEGTHECDKCTTCHLNRKIEHECEKDHNKVCGDCEFGYYWDSTECLPCCYCENDPDGFMTKQIQKKCKADFHTFSDKKFCGTRPTHSGPDKCISRKFRRKTTTPRTSQDYSTPTTKEIFTTKAMIPKKEGYTKTENHQLITMIVVGVMLAVVIVAIIVVSMILRKQRSPQQPRRVSQLSLKCTGGQTYDKVPSREDQEDDEEFDGRCRCKKTFNEETLFGEVYNVKVAMFIDICKILDNQSRSADKSIIGNKLGLNRSDIDECMKCDKMFEKVTQQNPTVKFKDFVCYVYERKAADILLIICEALHGKMESAIIDNGILNDGVNEVDVFAEINDKKSFLKSDVEIKRPIGRTRSLPCRFSLQLTNSKDSGTLY